MARPPGPRPAAVCARVRSWKQCAPLQSRLSGNLALGLLRRTGHPRRGSVEPRGVACRPLERLAGAAPPLQHARASGLPLGLQQVQHVSSEHGCRGDRLRRRGAVGNREAREHPLLLPSAARRHRGGGRGLVGSRRRRQRGVVVSRVGEGRVETRERRAVRGGRLPKCVHRGRAPKGIRQGRVRKPIRGGVRVREGGLFPLGGVVARQPSDVLLANLVPRDAVLERGASPHQRVRG
mmetsp:Transcript_21789/g.68355  ORF Transcript_21789/g.68355 Transcript_21789/m.68355 type:complete len:236 (+) Transcript_21789:109-816(+)